MGRTRKSQHTSLGKSLMKKGTGQPEWGSKQYTDRHSQAEATNGLKSVTQESSYEEFIATATLADKEFTAEKLNVKFVSLAVVDPLGRDENLLSEAERKLVVVPRRPKWSKEMSAEELDEAEKEAFLNWRRHMAQLQEKDGITPFERNIEVWRQLWRVVEKSEIIVQIVDGRNPLLYRCEDLEAYVREMGKRNVLLINKADFLTESQRIYWTTYFDSIGLPHAYYSAATENEILSKKEQIDEESEDYSDASEDNDSVEEQEFKRFEGSTVEPAPELGLNHQITAKPVLNRVQLIRFLKEFKRSREQPEILTKQHTDGDLQTDGDELFIVGFCGHPNVGKSSTINSLMASKKTSVSATPGKTKHFQTLFLEEDLMLCDCPGLVMPSFGGSQGEMVLGGILPIDTLTNYHPGMALLSQRIPKAILEKKYGIILPQDFTHQDLLSSYAAIRGFMTVRGIPDASRACRIFLKDYVNGKILYCHAPPNVNQLEFAPLSRIQIHETHSIPENQRRRDGDEDEVVQHKLSGSTITVKVKEPTLRKPNVEGSLDAAFFSGQTPSAHFKGRQYLISNTSTTGSSATLGEKPWRNQNKRNKKEKLRRVYRHLDVE